MKIRIEKAVLAEALATVQTVVDGKNAMLILQNVRITAKDGKVGFICSNLEQTMQTTAETVTIEEEGETTLPVKLLAAIAGKVADGEIALEVDAEDKAKITAGTSKFNLNGLAAKDFPAVPPVQGDTATMDCAILRDIFRKTAFAASVDDTRKQLKTILLDLTGGESLIGVATDGRRLAAVETPLEIPESIRLQFLVPRKTVDVLKSRLPRDGQVSITRAGQQVTFRFGNSEFTTKLIDDVYPNYKAVIPPLPPTTVMVNRIEFLAAIDRISVIATNDETVRMKIAFQGEKAVVSSSSANDGGARDEVPIVNSGAEVDFSVNPVYLKEALATLDEDEVEIRLEDGTRPMILRRPGEEGYTYVLMPLRNIS